MKLFLTKVRNLFDFKYCEDLEEDYNGDDDKEVVSVLLRLVPISHARTGGDKIWCFMVSRHSSDCNQADASPASALEFAQEEMFPYIYNVSYVGEMGIKNIPKESVLLEMFALNLIQINLLPGNGNDRI